MSLLPYVPRLAFRVLGEPYAPPKASRIQPLDVSVLLADVSGFTPLVDRLARDYGDRGAERLQDTLNRCFGPIAGLVDAHGGEVLCFSGDAALAMWTAGGRDTPTLADLTCRTVACGLDLLQRLDRLLALDEVELRLRVAVGAGLSAASLVGTVNGRWDAVLRGAAIDQLSGALEMAQPGEVVLSPEARECAGAALKGERRGRYFVARIVDMPEAAYGLAVSLPAVVPDDVVRCFVPASVIARVDAGQDGWLAEFRNVTVVFINVEGIAASDLETLQRTAHVVQVAVARFEGEVNRIVADEKGLNVVVAFGVAQRAHEDDAARAIRSSLSIRDELRELRVEVHVGLATGRVFTGVMGGGPCLEFAMLGASVVLAARLAAVADDILCDETTRIACRRTVRFESLGAVTLKGKPERVDVWRPFSVKQAEPRGTGLVGRRAERAVLERRVIGLERRSEGGIVLLEGEPGIGKTALLDDLMHWTRPRAVRILTGAADPIEHRAPYLAWRTVVASLIGADEGHDEASMTRRLIELVGEEQAPWLPLLNNVLPVSLPENDRTRSMDGEHRARIVRELLAGLLGTASSATPLLVVLEDAYWMDSASWDLLEYAVSQVPRLLLLVSMRPPADPIAAVDRLARRADATVLRLGGLSGDDVRELVCRRLDADAIPEELAALVSQRAEGHPLYAQELALALRDRGALVVRDGTCELTASLSDASGAPLPVTVRGIVATRIDQLTPQQQLILKVGAVIGRHFALADLAAIHPLGESVARLEEQSAGIVIAGLLTRHAASARSLSFSHAIVQEVAYELLPFTQRRELHRRTAQRLEEASSRNLDELPPLLAHHWERAEVAARAMHYLELAGERALLLDSSHREAEDFLTRLIALADHNPTAGVGKTIDVPMAGPLTEGRIRRGRWERLLSQALARQGRHADALVRLEHSISLLGHSAPSDSLVCRAEFLRGIGARLVRRPRKARDRHRSSSQRLALLEIVRAYDALVQYQYLGTSTDGSSGRRSVVVRSGLALLRSVRVAELAGPSAELSRTYSLFSNLIAMCRRPRLAAFYASQGRVIAEQVGDKHALFRALTIGQLPAFIRGEWKEVESGLAHALELGASLRLVSDCLIYEHSLVLVHFNQGRLSEAATRVIDVRRRARASGLLLPELWAIVSTGEIAFRQGRLRDAIACAEDALDLAERRETPDQNSRFQAHGLLASAFLRTEGVDRASTHVEPAMAAARAGARLSYSPQFGFIGVAEVLFALWRKGGPPGAQASRQLTRWLRILRLMAFCRPILEPWDLVFRALRHSHQRSTARAARLLRRAIRRADELNLPYERGVACLELARLMLPAERSEMLGQASVCFENMGALAMVNEARALEADASTLHVVG